MPALKRAVPLLVAGCAEAAVPSWCEPPAPSDAAASRALALADGAAWCTLPDETRDPAADLEEKARILVAEGVVPVGLGPLPVCVARSPTEAGLVAVGDASWQLDEVPGVAWVATAVQALVGPDGATGALTLRVRAPEHVEALALDGAPRRYDDEVSVGWVLDVDGARRGADACAFPDEVRSRHHVVFDGGEITLDLRVAASLLGTQPSAFERAEGVLRGAPFTTTDPWSLGYGPTHHHVDRSFLVRLPAAIDGVAAVEVRHADPDGAEPPAEVVLLDAAGAVVGAPAVLDEGYEVLPP